MKKNVLALSITAALVGLTGGAHAMTGALGGADATVQEFNNGGTGHSLIVPYFSTQGGNKTLINIVNTDTYNGKAVKVRFRGAANSDDIFDFQVFMSPGDVWTAEINQGADGRSRLVTNDVTCTKPLRSVLSGASFLTARLDQTMTAVQQANGTREGYVEIFNMADIPKDVRGTIAAGPYADAKTDITAGMSAASTVNPLYTAIKHVSKVAPCDSAVAPGTAESAAAWTFLDNNNLTYGAAAKTTPSSAGMLAPTTGLMANWTIINVAGAAAWSGEATAVEARLAAGTMATAPTTGVLAERANMGNVVYWPQTDALVDPAAPSVTTAIVEAFSADPIFRTANVYTAGTSGVATAAAAGAIRASFYDLPDMSTPYIVAATALTQAKTLTTSLATKSIRNEFLTDTAISASTDWLFSLPTRRYSVAFDYNFTAAATTNDGRRFTDINAEPTLLVTAFFNQTSTIVASNAETFGNGRQICAKLGLGAITPRDREESAATTPGAGVVISPSPIAVPTQFNICGEAAVLSVNNGAPAVGSSTGALKATVAIRDADFGTFRDGWATLTTPAAAGALIGLPVLGSAFTRAVGPTNGQTFGVSSNHRFQR